ncbi:hypothetical protein J1N35_035158 [Gossypium stocksii]|uniref:Retrotransposon Copia-like N-terminal domain-containing protein n=1 Tax=Gossypium stocksii TaxID=47602 RepID=A0A9D3UTD3_9ROSI|nr:hypothetical protein J1N35_035158 [Gossypium stocksii]
MPPDPPPTTVNPFIQGSTVVNLNSDESKTFFTKRITVILDDTNYLLWKQQILLTLKTHKLQPYIDRSYLYHLKTSLTIMELHQQIQNLSYLKNKTVL